MSSLRDLSERDLEALSAYLDGALPPAEVARLEPRLADDAGLRAALDDLRLTRRILRSAPALRPPRSFTLTPAQAGARRRPAAAPALRFAATLATVAFLAVSGLDLLGASLRQSAAAPAAAALPQPQTFDLQAPAGEAALESAAATEAPAEAAPSMLLGPMPTPTAPPAERAAAGTPGLGGGLPPSDVGGTVTQGATPEAMLAAGLPATPTPTPTPRPTPTLPAPTEPAASTFAAPPGAQSPLWGMSLLNWIELVLGGTAAALILATILLRRYA